MSNRFLFGLFVAAILASGSLVACGPNERTVAEWRAQAPEWEPARQIPRLAVAPAEARDGPSVSDDAVDADDDEDTMQAEEGGDQPPGAGDGPNRPLVIDATDEW